MTEFDWWRSKGPPEGGTRRGIYVFDVKQSEGGGSLPLCTYARCVVPHWPGRIPIVRVLVN
jgi:hypothetical protein